MLSSGVKTPFIYGTAWKKESTVSLTSKALKSGFRAIDTAAQPRHYREDLVGDGVRQAIQSGVVERKDLHLQTKYTPTSGQDLSNLPYDPSASVANQVSTSITSSLHNLRSTSDPASASESYIDCLILHSPLRTLAQTIEAWTAMSIYVPSRVRTLGISNTPLSLLEVLWDRAEVRPSVVQNRFYPASGYDGPLREFCMEKGIIYESFWTLTGNPQLVKGGLVKEVAGELGIEPEQAMYALVSGLGVMPLNGTKNEERMKGDLEAATMVEEWRASEENKERWSGWMKEFETLLNER